MNKDFLVELGCEELPPKSLLKLAKEFAANIEQSFQEEKLAFTNIKFFATPRRLAVMVSSLKVQAPDEEIETFGPPIKIAYDNDGKATKAAEAFARKNGIAIDALQQDEKTKKLVHRATVKGKKAEDIIPGIIENALNNLPIAKRMRWGSKRTEFVRPVKWLVLILGTELVEAQIYGVNAGKSSRGHRFHSNQNISLSSPSSYEQQLRDAKVIADFDTRREDIRAQVKQSAANLKGTAVIDEALLEEVTGLVELPVALAGNFDKTFLTVPKEALISSMKEHQKYFHVVNDKGELLPHFITLCNINSRDPSQVIAGNEKVIRPRLADAAFFFEQDKQSSQEQRREKLKTVVFQASLGSIYDKTEGIKTLAKFIASKLNIEAPCIERSAELCKSDLVSNMVNEFSDMQGIAGYHYAINDGEDSEVALALSEHYLPRFAGDKLPSSDTGAIIALADRLDTITGIFGIGQTPTGSKDPFALRRASLGVLRILLEKNYNLDLRELINQASERFNDLPGKENLVDEVLSYILDRFRSWYEDASISVNVFQSVSAKNLSNPLDINNRVYAVDAFSRLPEATALAAANKRVANILAKQDAPVATNVNSALLVEPAEKALAEEITRMTDLVMPLFAMNNYKEALSILAGLRSKVDAFFDHVMVMSKDEDIRNNRLALLQLLRNLFFEVADISLLDVKTG